MNPNDPNVSLLERTAEQLGEALLEQLVFVWRRGWSSRRAWMRPVVGHRRAGPGR